MSFKTLNLKSWLVKTLENVHIKVLTDIQKEALPLVLQGKDVLGNLKS